MVLPLSVLLVSVTQPIPYRPPPLARSPEVLSGTLSGLTSKIRQSNQNLFGLVIEKEKLRAIGARNVVESEAEARKRAIAEGQQRVVGCDRLGIEDVESRSGDPSSLKARVSAA